MLGQFARSKLAEKGYSRFATMTPEQRSAEAKKAAQTRWLRRNSQAAGNPLERSTGVDKRDASKPAF
jgi:hypothetical protein